MSDVSASDAIRHEPGDFGVYVHVPFCTKRCDYCAFATWTGKEHLIEEYVAAVCHEIGRPDDNRRSATSVFFGGGTPSLLSGPQLARILSSIERTADAEVTVECNPDTVSSELFAHYVEAGVNRLSFGVQSMVDHVLVSLGRTHNPDNVRKAVELARNAGITSLNLDLIYGGHGESVADWERTLREIVALDPPHVSAYGLTVEGGTPLADDPSRHPDDDDEAEKYLLIDDILGQSGLVNYEISNWARPGHECRHNWLYWAQGNYRGYGCAAHSHHDGRRFWNVRTPERFIELVNTTGSAESAHELLEGDARRIEGLQLSLRTRLGVSSNALSPEDLVDCTDAGLIDTDSVRNGWIRLTPEGRLLANQVAIRLR